VDYAAVVVEDSAIGAGAFITDDGELFFIWGQFGVEKYA